MKRCKYLVSRPQIGHPLLGREGIVPVVMRDRRVRQQNVEHRIELLLLNVSFRALQLGGRVGVADVDLGEVPHRRDVCISDAHHRVLPHVFRPCDRGKKVVRFPWQRPGPVGPVLAQTAFRRRGLWEALGDAVLSGLPEGDRFA